MNLPRSGTQAAISTVNDGIVVPPASPIIISNAESEIIALSSSLKWTILPKIIQNMDNFNYEPK